jgi:NADPH:quinone reductase-like Zn-dependent oxidoreductase
MNAVFLDGHGGLDRLRYSELADVPRPAASEVLIEVGAAGLNNTDINLRTGWYAKTATDARPPGDESGGGWTGAPLRFPRIQGADACGRIVATGTRIDPARVGERVLVNPVLYPEPNDADGAVRYFGSDCDGAFAGFVTVPAGNAVAIASALSDVELASFPCAYLAAENMLSRAAIAATDTVLVTGASGGVGSAAVQLARRRGATVFAVAGRAKHADVASLGATRILDRGADLVAELGRASITAVIDVVGGAAFPQLLELLKPRGRYAVAGAIGGASVELDLRTLYLKDLACFGCTIPARGTFESMLSYIERGEIRPVVSATFPLRAMADAQTEFLSKAHVGKIVLIPR